MRHRYILCGVVWEYPSISNYRLISSTKYSLGHLIRVNIPDDLKLEKFSNSYSSTDDERTIHELGCDCYIMFNGKWRKFNWLKTIEPYAWFRALDYIFGLKNCHDDIGWTDDIDYWKDWYKKRFNRNRKSIDSEDHKYPHLKEDKKGLKLKVNLAPEEYISTLRTATGEDAWIKLYDEFSKQLKENPNKEIWCE